MNDVSEFRKQNPMAAVLRMDRMPHIWCPGCGIGSVVTSFAEAIKRSGMDEDQIAVVSGIGCTGRVAGYSNFDSIHTTHGRAIPVATGLHLARPGMKVVVFSGDGDLTGIGGNHFIHAARRNMDLMVVCVNNFTYGMTGGQVTPTTPTTANASTTPYGNYEYPFSLPFLADAAGATYISRWTSLHSRNVTQSMEEALKHKGFSFIEVITPCTTLYLRRNRLGDGVDTLQYYQDNSIIKHGCDTRETAIDFQGQMIVGNFVNRRKPTYLEAVNERYVNVIGDDYQLYGKTEPEKEAEKKAAEKKAAKKAGKAQPKKAAAKPAAKKATPKKAAPKKAAKPAAKKAAPKKAAKPVAKKVAKPVAKKAAPKKAAKPVAKKKAKK